MSFQGQIISKHHEKQFFYLRFLWKDSKQNGMWNVVSPQNNCVVFVVDNTYVVAVWVGRRLSYRGGISRILLLLQQKIAGLKFR